MIGLWKFFGFLTGFIPSILGRNFIYTTIFYVETFVEKHYQEQINMLDNSKQSKKLKKIIEDLMNDEIDHKDDAKKKEFFNYVDKNYKGDHEEELDKEDKPTVQKVVKMLKKASKAHADQSKSLEKDLQDDVDKTIDTIQQANDSKRQSMRSILADIWKMNEGKSPFEKDEGFASDAQRRAAFASGYKAKGKKGKKEEIEKSDKTMTGKKPTKVEIEPQVK